MDLRGFFLPGFFEVSIGIINTKLLASPDRSGILFLASLARKRYSGWQERHVLKKRRVSASKKTNYKKGFDFAQRDITNICQTERSRSLLPKTLVSQHLRNLDAKKKPQS